MKTKLILLSVAAFVGTTLGSCNKYSEGPALSIYSKEERVANNWKIGQALDNGTDVTSDYNRYELNTTKSGGAELSAKYVVLGTTFEFVTNGKWSFVSDKTKLSFDFDNNDQDKVYKILKLKQDELWLKEDNGSIELHFVPK